MGIFRKRIPFVNLVVGLSLVFTVIGGSAAMALSGSEFKAGRIIDDGLFYNGTTMSATEIQNFVNAKVPSCDTWGQQMYNSTQTRAQYAASRGYSTPFTCLKDYRQDTGYKGGESGLCSAIEAKTNRSAAQIIDDVARACHISQKVIIVMLQKEQGLVTDDWPWSIQYRSAMGYGCPDTAACDSEYYGFFNQVYNAARQFQRYKADPNNWNHVPFMTNQILYQANAPSCGSRSTYIENYATAGLYNYTPYTPNSAALNNLYSTGDSCSAYGNRNFWRYYNDWFGSPYTDAYYASYVSQSNNPSLSPGESATAWITFKNMGISSWHSNTSTPVRLATQDPVNRSSKFYDPSWASSNRPTIKFETVYRSDGTAYSTTPTEVKPGESVRFQFKLTVPTQLSPGDYKEVFGIIVESGVGPITTSPTTPWVTVNVKKAIKAAHVTQSPYPTLRGGEKASSFITFKNTGNTTWHDNVSAGANNAKPVRLATMNPVNVSSVFGDEYWGSGRNRPTGVFSTVYKSDGNAYSTNPHAVKPGESAKFAFTLTAPDNPTPGQYTEYYSLIEEGGVGVINVPVTPWTTITVADAPAARPAAASVSENLVRTTKSVRTYTFKNTGTTTWNSSAQLKVVSGSSDGIRSTDWPSNEVAATLNEPSVSPGQTGSFTVTYNTTASAGSRSLEMAPAINGSSIAVSNFKVNLKIEEPRYAAKYHNQSFYPTMLQNSTQESFFRFKNIGNISWYDTTSSASAGFKPVVLASTTPINRVSKFNASFARSNRPTIEFSKVFESDGSTVASNQHAVEPGQIAEFKFTLTAPDSLTPGTYREYFQPIVEGGDPWDMQQIAWTDIKVVDSTNKARFYSQSSFPTISRGASANSFFSFKNIGNSDWYDAASAPRGIQPVTLASTNPINRLSIFREGFISPNRPSIEFSAVYESDGTTLASNQHVAKPGQIAKFNFTFKAPATMAPGTYREDFQPILEGGNPWSLEQVAWLYVTVN
jgi:hypothetical protein